MFASSPSFLQKHDFLYPLISLLGVAEISFTFTRIMPSCWSHFIFFTVTSTFQYCHASLLDNFSLFVNFKWLKKYTMRSISPWRADVLPAYTQSQSQLNFHVQEIGGVSRLLHRETETFSWTWSFPYYFQSGTLNSDCTMISNHSWVKI